MISKVIHPKLAQCKQVLVVDQISKPKAESLFNYFFTVRAISVKHKHWYAKHHQGRQKKEEEVSDVFQSFKDKQDIKRCILKKSQPVEQL